MHPEFIDSSILGDIAGISVQAARKAISKGKIQGDPIQVVSTDGTRSRGGRMGLVASSSLPAHLQQRLNDLNSDTIAPKALRIDETGLAEHNWKLDVIRPILAQEHGSSARFEEFNRMIGTTRPDWNGTNCKLSKSSLYRWVETFERNGGTHLCLAKRPRKDKGKQRVFVSLEWERAVPFDLATRKQIHHDLKQYMRGLIKGGAQRKVAMILTGDKLREISAAYGFHQLHGKAGEIPLDFYRDETHFKAVYRHKHDRKASEDNKPRIRRTIEGLEPMEVVVMDVHHINVRILRENGTTATPKLIAFHDIATNRVFCEIIMFEENGGVRNYDVIEAFIKMCQHSAFGVPRTLYADNGSEYLFADDLKDALKLNCQIVGFNGPEDRDRVIRAKPYNAAAKQVEGWFRQMNQQYFRLIKGWIDDDRMNPKRPTMGKLPAAFSDGFDALCTTIFDYLTAYEHMPQQGALKGNSPATAFRKHVDAGWTATLMDTADLVTIFTKPEPRTVRKHGVQVGSQFWTCDGLLEHFGGKVVVHIPKYHGYSALRITDERETEIGIAYADHAFEVLDQRGAKESARRSSVRNQALKNMDKSVPNINVGNELIRFGQRQEAVVPNTPNAIISVNRMGNKGLAERVVPAPKGKSRQEKEDEAREVDAARAQLTAAFERKVS